MAPDNRLDRPEDGSLSPAAEEPPRRPPKRPSSGRSLLRLRATRRDATPAAEEGRGAGNYLLRRLPRRRRAPPTRFQGGGGTFHGDAGGGGSGAERGAPVTSRAPPDPLPPKEGVREGGREGGEGRGGGREGGREEGTDRQSETNQASAARRTKQDFGKQTQTQTRKPRSKKGNEGDTRTPNKRKQNSTWVETVTKSKDNKHKQARVGGESALEVRRTWISRSLATNTGKAGGRPGSLGWQGCGGGVEGRGGEDRVNRDPLNKPRTP